MTGTNISLVAVFALTVVAFLGKAEAAIVYSTPGSQYSQNFDTGANPDGSTGLPNNSQEQSPNARIGTTGETVYGWRNDFSASTAGNWSIVGWHLLHPTTITGTNPEGGFGGNSRMRFGTGSSTTGAFYSFGANGNSSERALGIVNSNNLSGTTPTSMPVFMGAVFNNATGVTLTDFSLSFDGEQWRNSGQGPQSLEFQYSLNAGTVYDIDATWISVASLDFTSPVSGGDAGALDGNAPGNRTAISVTDFALASGWEAGGNLWIRWADRNDADADHGLAIDNVVFSANVSAVPEPTNCCLLLATGLAGMFRRHRRNRKGDGGRF